MVPNIAHKNFLNKIFILIIHLEYSKNIYTYITLFSWKLKLNREIV